MNYIDVDGRHPIVIVGIIIFVVVWGDLLASDDMHVQAQTHPDLDKDPVKGVLASYNMIAPLTGVGGMCGGAAGEVAEGGGRITDPSRLLPERAGPTGDISPSEVAGRTPAQIDARARELGLTPRGADPAGGRGAYIDPQTGQQRILSHPNASPPHGHVNNPAGQRIDINGNVVPPESPAAHLPLGGGR